MKWQKARWLDRKEEPFWVEISRPFVATFPPLNDDETAFDMENLSEGTWYYTNVLDPKGTFRMVCPSTSVELLSEFSEDVSMDDRKVLR